MRQSISCNNGEAKIIQYNGISIIKNKVNLEKTITSTELYVTTTCWPKRKEDLFFDYSEVDACCLDMACYGFVSCFCHIVTKKE